MLGRHGRSRDRRSPWPLSGIGAVCAIGSRRSSTTPGARASAGHLGAVVTPDDTGGGRGQGRVSTPTSGWTRRPPSPSRASPRRSWPRRSSSFGRRASCRSVTSSLDGMTRRAQREPDHRAPAAVAHERCPGHVAAPRYNERVEDRPDYEWTYPEVRATIGAPRFPPGKGFEYSNSNYVLLGRIIALETGHSVGSEIRRRFLEPLDLDDTWFQGDADGPREAAIGYGRRSGAWSRRATAPGLRPTTSIATFFGAAGRDGLHGPRRGGLGPCPVRRARPAQLVARAHDDLQRARLRAGHAPQDHGRSRGMGSRGVARRLRDLHVVPASHRYVGRAHLEPQGPGDRWRRQQAGQADRRRA